MGPTSRSMAILLAEALDACISLRTYIRKELMRWIGSSHARPNS